MTKDELAELLAAALDAHKANAPVAYKVDRGEWSDGLPWLYVDLLDGKALRVTVEDA